MSDHNAIELGHQVNTLVAELHHLRTMTQSQADTIGLMRQQYEQQAAKLRGIGKRHEAELLELTEQRDIAERRAQEVSGILDMVAGGAMMALRAWRGDAEPMPAPQQVAQPRPPFAPPAGVPRSESQRKLDMLAGVAADDVDFLSRPNPVAIADAARQS